jgi:hypothetical protein
LSEKKPKKPDWDYYFRRAEFSYRWRTISDEAHEEIEESIDDLRRKPRRWLIATEYPPYVLITE